MVRLLGATAGAAFVALTPAMTAVIGIPVLGEWPSAIDWLAIATISIGVCAVSGGPLPVSNGEACLCSSDVDHVGRSPFRVLVA